MNKFTVIITVQERLNDDGYWTYRGNLPGLYLAGPNRMELRKDIPGAIRLLFEKNYNLKVEVNPVVPFEWLEKELKMLGRDVPHGFWRWAVTISKMPLAGAGGSR